MQWDASPTGGFTTGTPWLPLVDPATRNVADAAGDPGSLLSLYRRLIAARRARSPALGARTHRSIFGVAPEVLAWVREPDGERVLVLLNAGDEPRDVRPARALAPEPARSWWHRARDGRVALDGLVLEPLEGFALRL